MNMKNSAAAYIAFCLLLLISVTPTPVKADIAPPPNPLLGGLGTFQYQNTSVQMLSERVEMEMVSYPGTEEENEFQPGVQVDAWFVMRNTGGEDETMQVVFPLKDMNECLVPGSLGGFTSYTYSSIEYSSFDAEVDGEKVETTTITSPHPWKDKSPVCEGSGVSVSMDWAAFTVTFPSNEDIVVRVAYVLELSGADAVQNVSYTLETGAAWKGPIGEAIIVFRFPYVVDNFIMPGTSPGYQVMQNEIYWRFENIEPSSADNVFIAYISPDVWAEIRDSRRRISANPKDDAAWSQLAGNYSYIAHWHGQNIRSEDYRQRAYKAYQDGLKAKPDSAVLNAGYADLYLMECCYYGEIPPSDMKVVRPYIENALKTDPSNEKALELLDLLRSADPDIDITVGPTFAPTTTLTPNRRLLPTATGMPLMTSTLPNTYTPRPTRTFAVTDAPTQAPNVTAFSKTEMSSVVTPVVQGEQGFTQENDAKSLMLVLSLFIGVGLVMVTIWRQLKRKS